MNLLRPFDQPAPPTGIHTVHEQGGCNVGAVEATGRVRDDGKLVLRVEGGPQDRASWLSANDRVHWAVKARVTKAWRLAGRKAGLAADVRSLGWERVHVTAYLHFADMLRRDPANYSATVVKAAIDGLVADAGLCSDDDWRHLDGPDVRLGAPTGRSKTGQPQQAAVTFVITNLGPALERRAAA